jgi:hypothetical protein
VATLILIPKNGYDPSQDAKTFARIPDMAAKAAQSKQHFLLTIDPNEYEVFSSMGDLDRVEVDESGSIRLNMTMFDFDGQA